MCSRDNNLRLNESSINIFEYNNTFDKLIKKRKNRNSSYL
jgi:hypothetical protein